MSPIHFDCKFIRASRGELECSREPRAAIQVKPHAAAPFSRRGRAQLKSSRPDRRESAGQRARHALSFDEIAAERLVGAKVCVDKSAAVATYTLSRALYNTYARLHVCARRNNVQPHCSDRGGSRWDSVRTLFLTCELRKTATLTILPRYGAPSWGNTLDATRARDGKRRGRTSG